MEYQSFHKTEDSQKGIRETFEMSCMLFYDELDAQARAILEFCGSCAQKKYN